MLASQHYIIYIQMDIHFSWVGPANPNHRADKTRAVLEPGSSGAERERGEGNIWSLEE